MYGKGLVTGLNITLKKFFKKKVTQQYPEVKPTLPGCSRGSFAFKAEECTACTICATTCPNRAIKVDFHQNEQKKRVLDNYAINLGYCMFCGLCTEACPTGAVTTSPEFELATCDKKSVVLSWEGNNGKEETEPAVCREK